MKFSDFINKLNKYLMANTKTYLIAYDIIKINEDYDGDTALYNNFSNYIKTELSKFTTLRLLNTTYLVHFKSCLSLRIELEKKFNELLSESNLLNTYKLNLWISAFNHDDEYFNHDSKIIIDNWCLNPTKRTKDTMEEFI